MVFQISVAKLYRFWGQLGWFGTETGSYGTQQDIAVTCARLGASRSSWQWEPPPWSQSYLGEAIECLGAFDTICYTPENGVILEIGSPFSGSALYLSEVFL